MARGASAAFARDALLAVCRSTLTQPNRLTTAALVRSAAIMSSSSNAMGMATRAMAMEMRTAGSTRGIVRVTTRVVNIAT